MTVTKQLPSLLGFVTWGPGIWKPHFCSASRFPHGSCPRGRRGGRGMGGWRLGRRDSPSCGPPVCSERPPAGVTPARQLGIGQRCVHFAPSLTLEKLDSTYLLQRASSTSRLTEVQGTSFSEVWDSTPLSSSKDWRGLSTSHSCYLCGGLVLCLTRSIFFTQSLDRMLFFFFSGDALADTSRNKAFWAPFGSVKLTHKN